jgi:hypothetical protein
MEKKEMIKQLIDLHKAAFENYFSMMVMLQDQTEKSFKPFINNAPGMNNERKKCIDHWTNEYKKSRDDFKKAVDNGYDKVEAFFDYNAILQFQEQNEKIFNDFISQANWLPEDFKKATEDLAAIYKNGGNEFKKYVDKNINHVENFLSPANKPQRNKAKRQK